MRNDLENCLRFAVRREHPKGVVGQRESREKKGKKRATQRSYPRVDIVMKKSGLVRRLEPPTMDMSASPVLRP